jgi:DNA-binding transcriptional ArsR family regulator
MNMTKRNPLQSIVSLFETISPLARLEILQTIGSSEACVCHLEAKLGYRQAYISQHLMALRQAGLLDSRREGKYIFYHLTKPEIMLLIQQAAKISGVNLPVIEAVSSEKQCGCPNCSPEVIENLATPKYVHA